jgi:hypothetical protein
VQNISNQKPDHSTLRTLALFNLNNSNSSTHHIPLHSELNQTLQSLAQTLLRMYHVKETGKRHVKEKPLSTIITYMVTRISLNPNRPINLQKL